MDILHRGLNNREATGFLCKGINLIGALPNVAEKTFDGIGTANVAVHHRRKRVKVRRCSSSLLRLRMASG